MPEILTDAYLLFTFVFKQALKLVDGPVLVNNNRVLLESKTFRLN